MIDCTCLSAGPAFGESEHPRVPIRAGVALLLVSGKPGTLLCRAPLRTGYVEFHITGCMSRERLC